MSEPFRPYEKLVDITILGKKFQVPERNSLLRCFQFISPETVPPLQTAFGHYRLQVKTPSYSRNFVRQFVFHPTRNNSVAG